MITALLEIFLTVGVGQGVIFALLLLFKKQGNRPANLLLAAFILSLVIPLWNNYVFIFHQALASLTLQSTLFYLPGIFGPLLYGYVLAVTHADKPNVKTMLALLVIPILGSLIKIYHFHVSANGLSQVAWYLWYLVVDVQILLCLYAAHHHLKQHQQTLQQNVADVERDKLDWLNLLLIGYFLLLLLEFSRTGVKLAGLSYLETMHMTVAVCNALFIFLLGFWGLTKPQIHFQNLVIKANIKYDKSTLSPEKAQQILTQLQQLMASDELFLESDISLVSLAQHLDVTPHHLSQVLNQRLQQNFYDFINSARIDKAKQMLSDKRFANLAIIDIAFQVGFNNKTSFNNAFKKYTKVTPGHFRTNFLDA